MRYLIPLLFLATPAAAHSAKNMHMHEADLGVLAALAAIVALSLTGAAVVRAVKVRK